MVASQPESLAQVPAASKHKTLALFLLLGLQSLCALFFLADAIGDQYGMEQMLGGELHHTLESLVVLALLLGVVMTVREIRRIMRRQRRVEHQLRAASGAFLELLEESFEEWSLTPSERDVALLAIKGLSIAEIAAVRATKEGTIKAQCNAIYRKAGVTGRPQLLSLFIEELMADGLPGAAPGEVAIKPQ